MAQEDMTDEQIAKARQNTSDAGEIIGSHLLDLIKGGIIRGAVVVAGIPFGSEPGETVPSIINVGVKDEDIEQVLQIALEACPQPNSEKIL